MLKKSQGDAIRFRVTFKDNGVLTDPAATSGKVYDSTGTELYSFVSLTKESTGVYTATWQTTVNTPKSTISFQATAQYGAYNFVSKQEMCRIV